MATTSKKSAKKSSTKTAAKKSAAKKSAAKTATVRRDWGDEVKLRVVGENPGNENSAAYKLFEAVKKATTVGGAKAKVKGLKRADMLIAYLRSWSNDGLIKVAA
jgi:hypothetical protein